MVTYTYSYASPLGEITLAGNEHALTGLWFVGQKYYADCRKRVRGENGLPVLRGTADCGEEKLRTLREIADPGEEELRAARETKDCREKILSIFRQTVTWLDIYFSGKEPDFMPPISLSGSPFQMEVWEILKTIPYGQTMTYGDIAAQIAGQRGIRSMSAQAVGGAVGRNPVSILVPCHRVVGAGGNLTGYAGGIDKKEKLLELERGVRPLAS